MLFPAIAGTGLALLVTDRSAELATMTLAVALLLLKFGSVVGAALTESVWLIVDPAAAEALTLTTKVKVAVALTARLVVLQT
jgi:hypothetical protein